MTIETGPSDLEDCARPNRFEIDLGVIAVASHGERHISAPRRTWRACADITRWA